MDKLIQWDFSDEHGWFAQAREQDCVAAGVDIICAQGTEAGGHTGDISTMVLLPKVVELCKGTGIVVVGAGVSIMVPGIAACLALGAAGAWLGSRFIMTEEANIQASAQQAIRDAAYGDTIRTEIYTGRPARTLKNAYNLSWERERVTEKHSLLRQGKSLGSMTSKKGCLARMSQARFPLVIGTSSRQRMIGWILKRALFLSVRSVVRLTA